MARLLSATLVPHTVSFTHIVSKVRLTCSRYRPAFMWKERFHLGVHTMWCVDKYLQLDIDALASLMHCTRHYDRNAPSMNLPDAYMPSITECRHFN